MERMGRKAKVSIIITMYNVEKYIEECINSVVNQSLKEIEIICVDDCSTDKTRLIVENMMEQDERITILKNETNVGLASSMNVGIRHASGQYIYNLDGDDYLLPGALEKLYNISVKNDLDVLTFGGYAFNDTEWMMPLTEEMKNEYVRKNQYDGVMLGIDLFCKFIQNNDKHGNTVFQFINRDFFINNNLYFVEGIGYGVDSPLNIYSVANRAMCIPDNFYMRRYRAESMVVMKKKKYQMQSLCIQYMTDLCIWHSLNVSEWHNKMIEKFMLQRLRTIKCMIVNVEDSGDLRVWENHPAAKHIFNYMIDDNYFLFYNNLTENKLNEIKEYKNVLIYGAGDVGRYTLEKMRKVGINNLQIVVTKATENQMLLGYKVHSITDIIGDKESTIVLLAVGDMYKTEIKINLLQLGYVNIVEVCNF